MSQHTQHTEPIQHATPKGEVELAVEGMTCASCVARVERKLNKVEGVNATVNLPLESAHVRLDSDVDDDALIAAVHSAGYGARVTRSRRQPHSAPSASGSSHSTHETDHSSHHQSSGHQHTEYRGADLLRRLRVAVVLAVPVIVLSMIPAIQFPGKWWLVAALSLPVATWSAWPFHSAAARAARHGASTMDTLVSLGVIAATVWSLWVLVADTALGGFEGSAEPHVYFEVAAVVTTFLLAGRYIEWRSKHRAGDALQTLLALGAKDAQRVEVGPDGMPLRSDDGAWRTTSIPAADLQVGDVFTVRPGSTIATDGTVIEGSSAIDTSLVTGEPVPVDVAAEDAVVGGTVNTSGHLLVRATRVGEETSLAQIGRLVSEAQTGKAPIARLADRISAVFVPVVLVIAVLTLAVWLLATRDMNAAFTAAVAVLIIACPCALGLATPTAILVGTGRGAQLGILIRGPEALEQTRRIDTIVLDKTGTVTQGKMQLEAVLTPLENTPSPTLGETTTPPHTETPASTATAQSSQESSSQAAEVLQYAAAVERLSEHPIAEAIAQSSWGTPVEETSAFTVSTFVAHPGGGVEGLVGQRRVAVGRAAWLHEQKVDVPGEVNRAVENAENSGATAVVVALDDAAQGVLVLRDPAKPTSSNAIAELKELGLHPLLLTGDNEGAARHTARTVGIAEDDVIARVLPDHKAAVITQLQSQGHTVAMVGDGVNDAAALASADLGLAMGTGTDVAMEASDITLIRSDLQSAATSVRLSRRTLQIIKQNLFWAFAYNTAAIPLAASGLLNPMIAGAAMAASSVIVVANSLRLRSAG